MRAGAKVIDVSPASFAGSDALRASVARAIRKQVVVVAAIGERPQEEGQPGFREYGAYEPDENVLTFPAAYPGVLGVGVGTAEGSFDSDIDVASDAIDVVAPVSEAVSTTKNGSTCVIDGAPPPRLLRARSVVSRRCWWTSTRTTTRPRSRR